MKSDRIWIQLLVGFLVISVVLGLIIVFTGPPGKKGDAAEDKKGDEEFGSFFKTLTPSKEGIAVVRIYGPIQTESSEGIFGFYGGADYIVKKIRRFRRNKLVRGLVIRVNSPGGTVAASQEILSELKKARRGGKKVVVSMGDLAASGGYYISCHADKIYADPGTITGSIGVFVGNLNLTELAKKIGVGMNIIKSGKYKDILSPWRDMTEEERALLQETVSDVYGQFLHEVSTGRHIPMEELKPIADGRIFTGKQAKKLKLIDETGGLQDAIDAAARLAGLKGEPEIIRDYESWWEDMFTMMESSVRRERKVLDLLKVEKSTTDYIPVTYLYNFGG